jgi:hypothetical protein
MPFELIFAYYFSIAMIGSRVLLLAVQEASKRKLTAITEYAKFLEDIAKEMTKEVQISRK